MRARDGVEFGGYLMLPESGLEWRGCNGGEQYYYDRSMTQLLGA